MTRNAEKIFNRISPKYAQQIADKIYNYILNNEDYDSLNNIQGIIRIFDKLSFNVLSHSNSILSSRIYEFFTKKIISYSFIDKNKALEFDNIDFLSSIYEIFIKKTLEGKKTPKGIYSFTFNNSSQFIIVSEDYDKSKLLDCINKKLVNEKSETSSKSNSPLSEVKEYTELMYLLANKTANHKIS